MEKELLLPRLGLDMGTFAVKGCLVSHDGEIRKSTVLTAGNPLEAAQKCLTSLLDKTEEGSFQLGLTGANAELVADEIGVKPLLEIEALQAGLAYRGLKEGAVLSLGHENMYYLELDGGGTVTFFNRNGQCAAGSGAFWYQQATRMGFDDQGLAELALEADSPVKISGRCAVFAKSDMTHAINEGATQGSVSAGMARALADMVLSGVALNRIEADLELLVVGGVANNRAVMKYIEDYCRQRSVKVTILSDHQYLNALGAALRGRGGFEREALELNSLLTRTFVPDNPLPALDPGRVKYMESDGQKEDFDLTTAYIGVDCGSVSTKCVLVDAAGIFIGGIYLPTAGRPALQVLELMKKVDEIYGHLLDGVPLVACTTGSGRFLSQKILSAEYAVDEITCQAEGIKYLCGEEGTLSIIEIGGEDSKFLQLKDGLLSDYNMNPVCAAGTGTFLENLAGLLGVTIEEEFSSQAFRAEYAIDLGDTCTLLSQSTLVSASSRGLPLSSQLASLAYSSARNYIRKTVEARPLEGKVVFSGATAKNHALASAFAAECDREIIVPPYPELSGALGSALIARIFHCSGQEGRFSFRHLNSLNSFQVSQARCKAECEHEHNCTLDVIEFSDGSKFLYGDRCGRYSELDKKAESKEFPDYLSRRSSLFMQAAGVSLESGPRIGIARAGMFFDLYPFWAVFFRELGCSVVLSPETSDETMEKGKRELEAEMCYPLEVLVGHYRELMEQEVDYIFVPEVVDMEPLPWAEKWPKSFTCPLMQTIKGVVANSLKMEAEQILYVQLNYRGGRERILIQLESVAEKMLGTAYSRERLEKAVDVAYEALEGFRFSMRQESRKVMEDLRRYHAEVAAVFLGRPYTIYDEFVSKGSLRYARGRGILALPQDFLLEHLGGWYTGELEDPVLEEFREEFQEELEGLLRDMDNIYSVQLQKMLSAVFLVNFLNERTEKTGLPVLNVVFQDPFKCGPNAMLRHFLGTLTPYLRLTLDEHTAPAGMITRLEAFKNTCLSRKEFTRPVYYSARTRYIKDNDWEKVLIPEPTHHARIVAAAFRNCGVEAEILPRSKDADLSLARRFVNGDECLPLIQNVQDFLGYLEGNGPEDDGVVFFQGWACGPCRYGLYAPTQSLILNKAGYGERKILSVKLDDVIKRFGYKFAVNFYAGMMAMDGLYKLLHATRPYEMQQGFSDALFDRYSARLEKLAEEHRFSLPQLFTGSYMHPFQRLLREAAEKFAGVAKSSEQRPLILLGGEWYVRLDERCNREIIRKVEEEGGEVSLAPASELFGYTVLINYHEARAAFEVEKSLRTFFTRAGYGLASWLAHRSEKMVEASLDGVIRYGHEPSPQEIRENAQKYVSKHYGGEPPMAIGRICSMGRNKEVGGIIFVNPFTCMPGSVVESQMGALREDLGLPMVTLYYDGKESANRDEFIESLVFQARIRI